RFAAVASATVIGSKPDVATAYPAASSAHQTELPAEEPLGYRIDAMLELEPSSSAEAQATGPTSDDPSPLGRGVGLLSRTGDPARDIPSPPGTFSNVAGSLPLRRRKL